MSCCFLVFLFLFSFPKTFWCDARPPPQIPPRWRRRGHPFPIFYPLVQVCALRGVAPAPWPRWKKNPVGAHGTNVRRCWTTSRSGRRCLIAAAGDEDAAAASGGREIVGRAQQRSAGRRTQQLKVDTTTSVQRTANVRRSRTARSTQFQTRTRRKYTRSYSTCIYDT